MPGRKRSELPPALIRARDRFAAWRDTRKAGDRIPASLWALATKLAATHGTARVASALRLDYYALKKRVGQQSSPASSSRSSRPEFVECTLPIATLGECTAVFEDGTGASMRVRMKNCQASDLATLGRSFWNAE